MTWRVRLVLVLLPCRALIVLRISRGHLWLFPWLSFGPILVIRDKIVFKKVTWFLRAPHFLGAIAYT